MTNELLIFSRQTCMWSVRTSLASRSTQSTTIIVWQCQRILRLAVAEHQKKTCMAAPSVARALRRRRRHRAAFRRTSQNEKDSRFSFFFLLLASPLQLCAVHKLAVPIERTPYPTTTIPSSSMLCSLVVGVLAKHTIHTVGDSKFAHGGMLALDSNHSRLME